MSIVRAQQARRHETPNAVMSTLASPSQGGAELSLWRVAMTAGQQGPEHTFDTEQVWTVLSGGADVEVDGETDVVTPGDTLILAAGAPHPGSPDRRGVSPPRSPPPQASRRSARSGRAQ